MVQKNQLQKTKLALEAFGRYDAVLYDALVQPHMASELATQLYNGAIITSETREAIQFTPGITPRLQADLLLHAVESSINTDYTRLRKFIRVLKKVVVLKPIAKQLRRCYSELISEAESSSSESDTDPTQQQPHEKKPLVPAGKTLQQHEEASQESTPKIGHQLGLGSDEERNSQSQPMQLPLITTSKPDTTSTLPTHMQPSAPPSTTCGEVNSGRSAAIMSHFHAHGTSSTFEGVTPMDSTVMKTKGTAGVAASFVSPLPSLVQAEAVEADPSFEPHPLQWQSGADSRTAGLVELVCPVCQAPVADGNFLRHWSTECREYTHIGTRVKKKALSRLMKLLSPVVHSWTVFARHIGVPGSHIALIRAANPPAGPSYLCTCFTQALDWWVSNHHNPTYEAIIAVLDPKRGQTTSVMNRALARQVKKFMSKEQQVTVSSIAAASSGSTGPSSKSVSPAKDDYTIRNLTIIKGKFECLRQVMCTGLQDKLSQEQIKKELCPFLLSIVECESADWLPGSFTLEEIFKAMTDSKPPLWSYWNYFPLELLVEKFGDEGMQSKVEQYKQDRSSFQVATKIKDYIPVATTLLEESDEPMEPCPLKRDAKYCWKLRMKLKEYVTEYSLDYLESLWKSLANVLFLPPISLVLETIIKDGIIVTWLIPAEFGPKVIKIAQENTKMFARYHSLLSLTVGNTCVYKKEYSKNEFQDRYETLYLHLGRRLHETLTKEQISNFRPFVVSLLPAVYEQLMPKSSDPREIFEAITYNQLWDCWNYSILERINTQFGDSAPEMTSRIEQYKSDLLQFQQATSVAVNGEAKIKIREKFNSLLVDTCVKLEKKLSKQQVKDRFRPFILTHLPREAAKSIPNCSNLKEIFEAVSCNKLWDCWNYFLLEVVIIEFDPEMTSQMELYKKDRGEFQRKIKIKDYIPTAVARFGEPSEATEQLPSTKQTPKNSNELSAKEDPKCFIKLQMKLPKRIADYPLMYLENLWKSLSSHMSLPPTAVLLFDIVLSGSIFVAWLIPTEISPQVLNQARYSNYFYKSLRVQKVIIGEDCVYEDKSATDDAEEMHAKQGGYDCDFVEQPPGVLETKCPICHLIPREPHHTTCCGNSFCGTCIGHLEKDGMDCPICKESNLSIVPNKKLDRSLKNLTVRCLHGKSGCQWIGELKEFDSHLNENPNPRKQLKGCNFVEVECIHGCGDYFQRRLLANHQEEICPKILISTDEAAQIFKAAAMKHGFIKSRNFKLFIVGAAGVGKAHLLAMIMGRKPPLLRHSIQYLKHLIPVTRIGKYDRVLGKSNDSELKMPDTVCMSAKQLQSQGEAEVASAPPDQSSIHPIFFNIENDLLLQKIKTASGSEDTLEFDCVDVIDFYIGRPDFLEVLPNSLDKATGILFVLKLSEEFSEHQTIENYNDKGELVGTYQSVFTNEQMLRRTLQSQIMNTSDNRHVDIAIIGSYKDQEHKSAETCEEKNANLQNMVSPGLQDDIFYYGRELKDIIFPVNAKEPGPEEKEIAKNLWEVFVERQSFEPDEIPLQWYGLHLALQKLVRDLARGVLSKEECLVTASSFDLGEKPSEAALKYLHSLKFLHFYDAILPQVVFADPHVPLDKLMELFEYSQQLREAQTTLTSTTGRLLKFRDQGIFTIELLSDFPRHYSPGLFTPLEMIQLFISQLVVAEVQLGEYFMPSLLPVVVHAESQQISSIAPLLLYFPNGSLPMSFFCALVCYLISHSKWRLLMQSGTPVPLTRNSITFEVPGGIPGIVTLSDSLCSYFEVSCPQEELLSQIRQDIVAGIYKTSHLLGYVNVNPQEGFICPVQDRTCSHSPHLALIDDNHLLLKCTINPGKVVSILQQKHKVWWENSEMLAGIAGLVCPLCQDAVPDDDLQSHWITECREYEEPTVPHSKITDTAPPIHDITSKEFLLSLKSLSVELTSVTDWYKLGISLGLTHMKLRVIESRNPGPKQCKLDVFDTWLQTHPNPSWRLIVAALYDMGEDSVAERLRQKYIPVSELSEEEKEKTMTTDISMLQGRFQKLLLNVCIHVKRKVCKEEISDTLQDFLASLPSGCADLMPQSSDLSEIIKALSQIEVLDFWNYFLLEHMMDIFQINDPELASKMEQYKNDRLQFQVSRDFTLAAKKLVSKSHHRSVKQNREILVQLSIKVDKCIADVSVYYIDTLHKMLASILSLPPFALLFHTVLKEGMYLDWYIPTAAVHSAQEALQNLDIHTPEVLSVLIDNRCIYHRRSQSTDALVSFEEVDQELQSRLQYIYTLPGQTGYDCNLIQRPQAASLQTDCPLCVQILRAPYQTSCCYTNFCQNCIRNIKEADRSCPVCNKISYQIRPNKEMENLLKDLRVQCRHYSSGCEWTGKLAHYEQHQNLSPSPESRVEGCAFVEIECVGCENQYQRHLLDKHEKEDCVIRPYSCEYCHEYSSFFLDVVYIHWKECTYFLVPCRQNCGLKSIERQNLKYHIDNECPLTVVECDFHYAGCEELLPREDMAAHLANAHKGQTLVRQISTGSQLQPSSTDKRLEDKTTDTEYSNLRVILPQQGYDCKVIECPPEHDSIRTECPICLTMLRNPQRLTCCGYSYCKVCIESWEKRERRCPTCAQEVFSIVPNKPLKTSLNQYTVMCPNEREGCEWTGKLVDLDEHLNESPRSGEELAGCEFINLECTHCGEYFLRRYITPDHMNFSCFQQQYHETDQEGEAPTSEDQCHTSLKLKVNNSKHFKIKRRTRTIYLQMPKMEEFYFDKDEMLKLNELIFSGGNIIKRLKSMLHAPDLEMENEMLRKSIREKDEEINCLRRHRELSIKNKSQLAPTSCELPGVDFMDICKTRVHGITEMQTIKCHGFKMHIPALALPESEECEITVATCKSGAFVLPPQTTLISSVYYTKSSRELPFHFPVTIELEHCCDLDEHTTNGLVFATAVSSTKEPPFVFTTNRLGMFLPGSSFGQLSASNFCFFTIVWDRRGILQPPSLRYCAHVYYRCEGRTTWRVILVITKKLQACSQAVKELYHDSCQLKELTSFDVRLDPECDNVYLDGLKSCGEVTNDGCWKIWPAYPPQMRRCDIDNFSSGRFSPAKCELNVRWLREGEPPRPLEYTVHLKGAEPNYFNIMLDPSQPDLPVRQSDTAECFGISPDSYTEIDESDILDVSSYLLGLEKTHIYNLGLALGLSQRKVKAMEESRTFLDDILSAWIRKEDYVEKNGNPSWGTLVEALRHRRLNQNGLAKQIIQDRPWMIHKTLGQYRAAWDDDRPGMTHQRLGQSRTTLDYGDEKSFYSLY